MKIVYLLLLGLITWTTLLDAAPQSSSEDPNEPIFQLPVQLVGFPVIIFAVRIANFVKKLTYTFNPRTYISRVRREALPHGLSGLEGLSNEDIDVSGIEHKLVVEMGPDVCLFEDICQRHAAHHNTINWDDVVKKYETYAGNRKKFYLLSVFLGDIVSSPKLCHQIALRPGRACK